MAGYIGSKSSVTLVDGYTEAEADAEFVNDPNGAITVSGSNVGIGTSSPAENLHISSSSGSARIRMTSADGSDNMIVFGDASDSATGAIKFDHSNNALSFNGYNNTERMRIDSSGKVGIGTTSPDTELNIGFSGADDTNTIRVEGSNGASERYAFDIEADGENAKTNFKIGVGGGSTTTCMTLDSSGHVLVGKTNANNTDVGTTIYNTLGFSSTRSGGVVGILNRLTNDGDIMQFRKDNATVGSISVSGSSTSYNTSSDYRLKENVVDLTGASARVNQLNPSRFNFISDDTNTAVDGFLAHEVATVVPEAITGTKDAMKDEEYEVTPATGDIYTPATEAYVDDDGNDVDAVDEVIHSADAEQPETLEDGQQWRETTAAVMGTRSVPDYQGIDQSKLVPLLTAALQEALTEIASLKTRVEALEA